MTTTKRSPLLEKEVTRRGRLGRESSVLNDNSYEAVSVCEVN